MAPTLRHLTRNALLAAALAVAPSLCAQTHPTRPKEGLVKYVIGDRVSLEDSIRAYKVLTENIPVDPEFTAEPTFALVSSNRQFYFSLGMNLKVTACYDWGNPILDPSGFNVSQITEAPPGDSHALQMTAQSSSFYFNVVGFPRSAHRLGLFLSVGLDGGTPNSYYLHAGHVYMRYRDLQAGYTTSLYNDRAADPYTIDGHGPSASGSHSAIQFNWQRYTNRHWRFGVSIELPHADYTPFEVKALTPEAAIEEQARQLNQYVPDFPFYAQYGWDRGHVRLSGVLRSIRYRNALQRTNHTVFGTGLKFTGDVQAGNFIIYAMAQSGRGIASFMQDNRNRGLDLVPDGPDGDLTPTTTWGCIGGLQYYYTPRLFSDVVFSYLRNYVPDYGTNSLSYDYADQQRCGWYVTANLIWPISSLFRTGIEYTYGCRESFSGKRLSDNRVSAMLMMTF